MAFAILLFLYLLPIFLLLAVLARFMRWTIRQLASLVGWLLLAIISLPWKMMVWLCRSSKKSRVTR